MENQGIKKRVIISIGFIVLFAIIGLVLYYFIAPDATCTDKKQNQGEKGIDCGGPCSPCKDIAQTQDLSIKEIAVALGGNNTYDTVAKITNPNDAFGASSFKYKFNLKDVNGNVVASREGSSFVLPADSRYVSELGFAVENGVVPTIAEFTINDVKWAKLSDIGKPQIGVYSKNFGKVPAGVGYEADGVIRNESGYNLNEISIVTILRDEKGQIIGVNQTKKNSVRTKEERDFRLTWPYELAAQVQSMDVDVQSNVFDSSNFSFTVQ